MNIYKIRRSDGLFSSGGHNPRFNKTGKIWKNLGHLKNHLLQVRHFDKLYTTCEVVTYEVTEVETEAKSISVLLSEVKDNIQKKQELSRQKWEARSREVRKQEYEKLKKEFDK